MLSIDVHVAPEHEPVNGELDDEVPNQEAVNGIARSTRAAEPAWRDLGLQRLMQQSAQDQHTVLEMGDRLREAMRIDQRHGVTGEVSGPPARTIR